MSPYFSSDIAGQDGQIDEPTAGEHALFARLKQGESAAFDTIYRLYYPDLAAFAARYVSSWEIAEEIVQDVFVMLWVRRTTLEIATTLRGYLYGAVRNAALNILKHDSRITRAHTVATKTNTTLGMGNIGPSADTALEQAEAYDALHRTLATLPERQHAAIVLRYEHDLGYTDIAGILEISDVAARKLVIKGEARLRRAFTEGLVPP